MLSKIIKTKNAILKAFLVLLFAVLNFVSIYYDTLYYCPVPIMKAFNLPFSFLSNGFPSNGIFVAYLLPFSVKTLRIQLLWVL